MDPAEVLLIGGRAGVGKTTVGWEVSARLRAATVAHCVIEGDFMGQVHPAPEGDPRRRKIVERNLTALWSNYAELGHRRLIYTNTVSVLAENEGMFLRAMGADVRILRVVLTASDATARERLTGRERGSELERELEASSRKARILDAQMPPDTVRVATDGRTVADIAREVVNVTGWPANASGQVPSRETAPTGPPPAPGGTGCGPRPCSRR
ncbi:AAA family ATPase [Streptomyces sp. NPDC091368]|uniref:AAA family ATPase n=1 Tax=Streptomyces sp. NPDC091368 TaxID=3365993 RepID=UPI003812A948